MGYYIDLEKITIDDYRIKLEAAYLPPSRMLLKERTSERFECFKRLGITNVKELTQLLKKKDQLAKLQKNDCFEGDYLVILLRELNSILPKPNKIRDFEGIQTTTFLALEQHGITNTQKLYDWVVSSEKQAELSGLTGISNAEILELTKLSDLSRIKWVGAGFARLLYDLGVDTVEKVSQANPVELHEQVNQLIRKKNSYKVQIGLNDIKILIQAAKEIPFEMEI